MSAVTIDLPNALQVKLEQIAKESGVSVAELLIEAADKLSQIDTLEKIKKLAERRDTRTGFDRLLAAVPDVDPVHPYDLIK